MKEINISKVITMKRREKGITQDELAEYMSVSKASVSKWETGQSYPDITLLPQLATFFNISIDELIGYLPQMTKEEIKKNYNRLANAFSSEPFDKVYEECLALIKKYYSCFPLLMEMVALLLNHQMLAGERQIEVLGEIIDLCGHIKQDSEDIWLSNQANSMEAMCLLIQQKPIEVIDLLEKTAKPELSEEVLLANAYHMSGRLDKAKQTLQASMYRHIISLLDMASMYLMLFAGDLQKQEQILQRFLSLSQGFGMNKLRPDLDLKIYYAAATAYMSANEHDKALTMLESYAKASASKEFATLLRGDEFFDQIEKWFEENDMHRGSPRNIKVIRADVVALVKNNPVFSGLQENANFQRIVRTLEDQLNGGN